MPLDTLSGPVRAFAEWNPVSAVTQAARDLFGNADPNPLTWVVRILAIFVPLADYQYRRSASR